MWINSDINNYSVTLSKMNEVKRSSEIVGCKNASVRERYALEESTRTSSGGRSGSKIVRVTQTLVRIQCPKN